MCFKEKVVIITGGSRGIGRALATAFAKEGATVVINYKTSNTLAEFLAHQIRQSGGVAIARGADVTKEKEVKRLMSYVFKKFGRIDILINNAGLYKDSTVHHMTGKIWNEVVKTNLYGPFYTTKHAIPYMKHGQWGRIINISSVVGQVGAAGTSNYSASKAGLFGFTKAVAKEVALHGITVNALALGYFDAGMLQRLSETVRAWILKLIPRGRWGRLDEVTEPAMFLASDGASYITGQVIHVNGGYYM